MSIVRSLSLAAVVICAVAAPAVALADVAPAGGCRCSTSARGPNAGAALGLAAFAGVAGAVLLRRRPR